MKHSAVIVAAAGLASASLTVRQAGSSSAADPSAVCSGPDRACSVIENIQRECTDQAPSDVRANAACMCKDNARFFSQWQECRQCLADNNLIPKNELPGWLACNKKAQADLCGGNPPALYQPYFETLFPGSDGTCAGGQSQGTGASGAPGSSRTTGMTTATTAVSASTTGTGSTGSAATGVAPSTESSSRSGASNPVSTSASTTGARNNTSSSSRPSSSNPVTAGASPKAAFASVLAIAAAGAGFFMAL